MEEVTATYLRENLFKLFDEIIKTGNPLDVSIKGNKLKIVPEKTETLTERLAKMPTKTNVFNGDDDITKIVQKHFNTASEGVPQETKLQTAFQNEIANKVAQNNAAKRWEEH